YACRAGTNHPQSLGLHSADSQSSCFITSDSDANDFLSNCAESTGSPSSDSLSWNLQSRRPVTTRFVTAHSQSSSFHAHHFVPTGFESADFESYGWIPVGPVTIRAFTADSVTTSAVRRRFEPLRLVAVDSESTRFGRSCFISKLAFMKKLFHRSLKNSTTLFYLMYS
uniref:Uncharacterized protein n=1 Tax=Panagrolaimus sp. JU765 TaxID=591449 RepID=A0AC34RGV8_9BILA